MTEQTPLEQAQEIFRRATQLCQDLAAQDEAKKILQQADLQQLRRAIIDAQHRTEQVAADPDAIRMDLQDAVHDELKAWKSYAEALAAHLTAQEQPSEVGGPKSTWWAGHLAAGSHKPVQHRDMKEPWCNVCGLNADGAAPRSRKEAAQELRDVGRELDMDSTESYMSPEQVSARRLKVAQEANDRARDWLATQEPVTIRDSAGAPLYTVEQPAGEVIPSMLAVEILKNPATKRALRTIIGNTAEAHVGGLRISNAGTVTEAVLEALTDALTAGIESARLKAMQKAAPSSSPADAQQVTPQRIIDRAQTIGAIKAADEYLQAKRVTETWRLVDRLRDELVRLAGLIPVAPEEEPTPKCEQCRWNAGFGAKEPVGGHHPQCPISEILKEAQQ